MQASGINAIDALAYTSWNAQPGLALTLTYSFLATPPANAGANDGKGFVPMSAAQQDAARAALATWSAVASIDFVEVAGGGQLQMGVNDQGDTSGAYAYYPNPGGSSALYLNDQGYNQVFTPGSFGAQVLIHELGHSLGLKHPGNYNAGGGGTPGPYLPVATDNGDYTLMSYYKSSSQMINGKYPVTPMLYDVMAIQYLYGANTLYRTGDDVYAFGRGAAPSCIWDAGGLNTFDFSACMTATLINLNEGAFSETAAGLRNVSIAHGVAVRRAVAGDGGSTIIGNDLGDTITGGAGIDDVQGGAGHDSIAGGAGNDSLQGGGGDDRLDGGSGSDLLAGGAGDDEYVVDSLGDVIDESAGGGTDTVLTALAAWTLGSALEALRYTGGAAGFAGTGNALANNIVGGLGADALDGGAGDDTLDGAGAADTLEGGTGTDTAVLAARFDDTTRVRLNATDLRVTDKASGVSVVLRNIETILFDGVAKTFAEAVETPGTIGSPGTALADVLTGSFDADTLQGLGGNDTLAGLAGDDSLDGGIGNDSLLGGEGADTLLAGAGRDTLAGGDGDDSLDGGSGNDRLDGDAGDDTLAGGAGSDTLAGGAGHDRYVLDAAGDVVIELDDGGHDTVHTVLASWTLAQHVEDLAGTQAGRAYRFTGNGLDNVIEGNSGNDVLAGGAGDDTLRGGAGRDSLAGGDGDDRLEGGSGSATLDGGAGDDTAVFALALSSYTRSRPTESDLKLVDKMSGDIIVVRNIESFEFDGVTATLAELRLGLVSTGDDMLTGTIGADTIDGQAGNDTMAGLAGDDIYVVGAVGDMIDEAPGAGIDTAKIAIATARFAYVLADGVEHAVITSRVAGSVTGNAAANVLTGNAAANTLSGESGDDSLDGGAGNDVLLGGDGNDTLSGGGGSDALEGGAGDDVHVVDAAGDKVIEAAGGGIDTVRTALARWTMAAEVERLEYVGKSGFTGTGNALDNWIGGGRAGDRLLGGEGNDTLAGGLGNDTLAGGAGSDAFVLRFDEGSDTVSDFDTGIDSLLVDVSVRGIGNGDEVLDHAIAIAARGGFGTEAELVIVSGGTGTLSAAKAAALIGSASAAYEAGQSALFAVDNGTSTVLYRFVAAQADALVSAGELTQIAQLTGVADTTIADYALTR